jgi:hypothetical protein
MSPGRSSSTRANINSGGGLSRSGVKSFTFARRLALCALAVSLGASVEAQGAPNAPPTKTQCFASHGKAQELRLDSKLIEARSELRVCADTSCPAPLQGECANWLVETQQGIPTVVLLVESDTGDAVNVKVTVDGEVLTEKIDQTVYEFNPGAHSFKFEYDDFPANEQTVVLRQDEKRRVVRAQFMKEKPPEPTPDQSWRGGPAPTPAGPPRNGPRPVPVATYIFGGLALAGAGASAYFGVTGLQKRKEQQDTCAPLCSDSDVKEVKTSFIIADSAGGFAIVSATIAAIFYFTRPVVIEEEPPPDEEKAKEEEAWLKHLQVGATPNTVGATLTGSF